MEAQVGHLESGSLGLHKYISQTVGGKSGVSTRIVFVYWLYAMGQGLGDESNKSL